MSESDGPCTQEWVRQELILWEEGINAKIAALRSEVDELQRRLAEVEGKQPESLLNSPTLEDLTGFS